MTDFSAILARLEAATVKLESLAMGVPANGAQGNMNSSSTAAAASGDNVVPKALFAWDAFIHATLPVVETSAKAIGGVVEEQFGHFKKGLQAERQFIEMALTSKKPQPSDLPSLVQPIQEQISKVIQVKDKNRPSALFNHLSVLSEGVPALGWVVVEPTPAPYIEDMKEATVFHINRVLKEYKDKEKEHAEYVNGLKELLKQLKDYVKAYHTTGISWNPKGGDAKISEVSGSASATNNAAPAPPAAPAGLPPPPPPIPTAEQLEMFGSVSSTPSKPTGAASLFDELSKGNVAAGLRKVDKAEMTHKNPTLRASGVVKESNGSLFNIDDNSRKGSTNTLANKAPPKFALQGNKWVIENFNNDQTIVIDKGELKNVVYIYNCNQCTIQIKSKVNAVTIDNCKKSGLVLDSVVSTVDLVNCKSCQVQVTGFAPTVVIDKTEGLQLYLSDTTLETEVFTAKSSSVNILHSVAGEFVEKPVPEQLKTKLVNGKLETIAVEHKG